MKKPIRLSDAIATVFREHGRPMLPSEVLAAIEHQRLYPFLTEDRLGVVRRELRRHCEGLEFASARFPKRYLQDENGRFLVRTNEPKNAQPSASSRPKQSTTYSQILALQSKHRGEFCNSIVESLKQLDPTNFEHFGKRLLTAYGFSQVIVTRPTRDGGIDGHGRISFGMAHLDAAFQCKRYTGKNVSSKEVQQFRGAIQGSYQQGIFFSTASFTKDAQAVSTQPGAVPIALIDGKQIAELMIEKCLGVEAELVKLYTFAPDMLFDDMADKTPEMR